MSDEIVLLGVVVSSMPIGEYDKRVVLITETLGKIHAFARGARRTGSQLMAGTETFTFGKFHLRNGKNAYSLTAVEVENYFDPLRKDVIRAYYGFYFLELAAYFARENIDEKEMLVLLYQSFRALIAGNEALPPRFIRALFELKLLFQEGYLPRLDACVACGNTEDVTAFSVRGGGLVCHDHVDRYPDSQEVDASVVHALRYIAATPSARLYTFSLGEKGKTALIRLADSYRKVYTDGEFHALDMIEVLDV